MDKVRATLVGLGQRVNGPPGSTQFTPAPTPHVPRPKYYNVTGAGDAVWNGQYAMSSKSWKGEPEYISAATNCPNKRPCSLYSNDGVWRLASFKKELFYTAGKPSGATPPLSGWVVANGTAPAPALTAGPA